MTINPSLFSRIVPSIILSLLLISCGAKSKPEESGASAKADTASLAQEPEKGSTPAHRASISRCDTSYTGTIDGKIPIAMKLCRKGDELFGSYQYVKVGKDIEIQGHVNEDGGFVIYEWGDGPKKQTGNFIGSFVSETRMEGTWQTPKGERSMPFELTRGTAAVKGSATETGFGGSWTLAGKNDASFSLLLHQQGSRLRGYHCAVTENASRVDCSIDDEADHEEMTIDGTVEGNVARVTFRSTYGLNDKGEPVTGHATITLKGGTIEWNIVDEGDGEHYLPEQAVLKREE